MAPTNSDGIDFGLIFFSSSEAPFGADKYRLVLESTKFADQHGFSAVWIPERHFTKDGWLYPNPAVLSAALARETQHIQLRAGSVVIPLHNPLRVAEEWSMVDNLSNGRVGLSFASGWHPNDFALMPENYAKRSEEMYRGIEMVRKLWRGEAVQMKGGDGNLVEIKTYPPPLQKELPFWVTAAGNPKTFAGAGELGANLLTHMYNQSVDELAEKIGIYREARARHGFDPATGQVSVMLHTFVGADEKSVRAQVEGPFCEYLKSAAYLVNAIAYSRGQQIDLSTLSEQDLQDYLQFVLDRLISTQRVLFGTPETCFNLVTQLKAAGVNEIACQMDFGVASDLVLDSLPYLTQLKERCNQPLSMLQTSAPGHTDIPYHLNGHKKTTIPASVQHSNRLQAIQQRCQQEVVVATFYQQLHERGIQLAASFQGIERLWRSDGEALGEICLPAAHAAEATAYQIHPTLLDACFQVLIAAVPESLSGQDQALYLPTGIRSFQVYQLPGTRVWSHAQSSSSTQASAQVFEGDVRILDEQGALLAEALGLQLQRTEMTTIAHPSSAQEQAQTELNGWLYELQWEASPTSNVAVSQLSGTWLIFADRQGVGAQLAQNLEGHGASCVCVTPGTTYQHVRLEEYQVNPTLADDIRTLLADVSKNSQQPLLGVVHLWSLDATSVSATSASSLMTDQVNGVENALGIIQALIEGPGNQPPHLWLVTQGAQPVGSQTLPLAIAQSPLWGLGKTCALEHPELWGGLIDLDPQENVAMAANQLYSVLTTEQNEDQLAFRQGQRYVARLLRKSELTKLPFKLHTDASYLISGGLWGLGLEVARWLLEKGARHLLLLGRSKLPPREDWDTLPAGSRLAIQIAGLRALEATGAHVRYATVDISNEQQISAFFQDCAEQGQPPIRGVMHAASVWQDAQGQSLVRPLARLTPEALQTVFRPKMVGSWLLHTHLQESPLDFFVSFSSGASLFGSAAQGNYAAAGEFLDVLAHYQRAQGQPALSIDWGAISEIGFGATPEGRRVHEYWESRGIQRINPGQVLAALELLIPQSLNRIGVLKLDWHLLQEFYPQITRLPLISQLLETGIHADTQASQSPHAGHTTLPILLQSDPAERADLLAAYLSTQIAGVLRLPIERLDREQPLTALGLDSLMSIELKNRIEVELQVRIPLVTFLQGPSMTQFTEQVLGQLTEMAASASNASATAQPEQDASKHLHDNSQLLQQDAQELLAQIDQFSEQDVDTLLNQLLQEEQKLPENGKHTNTNDLTAQDAEQLLAQLDQLSDEQVEALLSQIAQKEEKF